MDDSDKEKIELYLRLMYVLAGIALAIGVCFYMLFEKLSFVDAFYFSVVTLATVGYGDITPHTDIGKIFTAFYIVGGIGIIGTFANLFMKNAAIHHQERKNNRQSEAKTVALKAKRKK